MKKNKLLCKIFCVVTVVTIILSTFVVYCSADTVYNPNQGEVFNVGLPFDLTFYGNYQGSGVSFISDFGGFVLPRYNSPLDKSNGDKFFNYSNSMPNDFSQSSYDNLSLTFNKFKYNYFTTSLTLDEDSSEWHDGVDYSITVRPMGSGEMWSSEVYPLNSEYISYLANSINGSTINSARNSFCSYPCYTYDGIISSMFWTSADNFSIGGYNQLPDYFLVTPYLEYDMYGDVEGYLSNYNLSLVVSYDVYLNGSSSVPESRYNVIDYFTYSYDGPNKYLESPQSEIDNCYSQAYNSRVSNFSNKIAFRDFKLPFAPIYDSIREQFDHDGGYISNLQIYLQPYNPNVSGTNQFLDSFYNVNGYYPIRACGLEYNDVVLPELDVSTEGNNAHVICDSTDLFIHDIGSPVNEYTSLNNFNLVSWLGNTVGSVMNVEIIGPITLGSIVYLVLGIGFLYVVIKFFAGG